MRHPKSFLLWLLAIALAAAVYQAVREFGDMAARSKPPAQTGDAIEGRARVVDGDSLEIGGERIRLFGIDAPEGRQDCRDAQGRNFRCGDEARRALADMIGGRPVACTPVGESHDRAVSVCRAGGRDLSEAMVREGYAVELPRHSRGRYRAAEREARDGRRGLWAGTFERPADWRQRNMR